MDDRFSQPVRDILCAAGWFDGRKVSLDQIPLPEEYSLFPKAEEVVLEFGGLHFGESRRGVNCAASDVEIMPLAGGGLGSHIKRYEPVIQTRLYPLGHLQGRHCLLIIDELGRIYLINSSLIRRARKLRPFARAIATWCQDRSPRTGRWLGAGRRSRGTTLRKKRREGQFEGSGVFAVRELWLGPKTPDP